MKIKREEMNNILIVDDSKTIVYGLKETIEKKLQQNVITAHSMKEASDLLLKYNGKISLALLDLGLPDAPNGEVVDFIAKFKIPSIILSGTQLPKDHKFLSYPNVIDYCLKGGSYAIDYSASLVKRIIKNMTTTALIIDDSKVFAHKIEDACKRYKLNTVVKYNAKDGLEVLGKNPSIKLILVDYMMEGMDGLELVEKVRKEYNKDEIAIIALSGSTEKDVVSKFLKFGANDFLNKDFTSDEFFARISNNLNIIDLFEEAVDRLKKDNMTGLYNREYLFDKGSNLYNWAKEKSEKFSVAILDIDKFKNLNDKYGHDIGDMIIKNAASVITKTIDGGSLVARLGSAEFCIILQNRGHREVFDTLDELRETFEKNSINLPNHNLKYTVSIGASIDFGNNFDDMIKMADEALFDAKEIKNQTKIFNNIF